MQNMLRKLKNAFDWGISMDKLRIKETFDNLVWYREYLLADASFHEKAQIDAIDELMSNMLLDYPEGFFD